jgi:hypothetical protein
MSTLLFDRGEAIQDLRSQNLRIVRVIHEYLPLINGTALFTHSLCVLKAYGMRLTSGEGVTLRPSIWIEVLLILLHSLIPFLLPWMLRRRR